MPRTILYDLLPVSNSISTTESFPLMVFTSCPLLILRNGLPNRTNVNASSIVDLPEPLEPTINVVLSLSNFSSVKKLPVLRKFFQRKLRKIIIQCFLWIVPQHKVHASMF